MTDGLFGGPSIRALESMLRFAAERHRVIALNVANASTSGWRSRDLPEGEFRSALAEAMAGGGTPDAGLWQARPAPSGTLKADGNDVDIETEMARMVRNQGLHAFAAALLAQRFTELREAVAERVLA
jgi:flagellar basal-body rod protein FlgB